MTTVKELIKYLKTFDQNLPVAFKCCSEYDSLDLEEVTVKELQSPRADGWIHTEWSGKPELPKIKYVVFPGN